MSLDIVGCNNNDENKMASAIPHSLSLNGSCGEIHTGFPLETKSFENGVVISSPDTSSCASTPLHESLEENCFSQCEDEDLPDENEEEIDQFVKNYVSCMFDTECDITYENKARFGDLMKDASARMSFAKYIDAYRNQTKCVLESTFYKLLHSFALVLFECGEADDYMPGKSLMNMAFTYYYIPDRRQISTDAFGSGENITSSNAGRDKIRAKSDSDEKELPKRKSFLQKMKKDMEAFKQVFHDTPSLQELKQGIWRRQKPSQNQNTESSQPTFSRSVSCSSAATSGDILLSPTTKNFLFEHLKNQFIWKSLRFWNAAFFSAVHAERKRRCIQKDWTALSLDERDSTNENVVNITFGQLGTFINNMKCLGLDNRTCFEFLRKQSVIGGIEEGGQYYQMLIEQIEDDTTF